jgi:predicted acetyltransferase
MSLKLVRLDYKYKRHLVEMLEEWFATGESITPYAIAKNDYHYFDNYLNKLDVKVDTGTLVPDSTFFLLDEDRDIFLGAINIRHYLNARLLFNGGNIGHGIRPSE